VDEESDKKTIKEIERNKWTTKRGFQYPPIKSRKELIQHPKRPHEARISDLQQPYEHFDEQRRCDTHSMIMRLEFSDSHRPLYLRDNPELKDRENSFKIPALASDYFGMLNAPAYNHDFELKYALLHSLPPSLLVHLFLSPSLCLSLRNIGSRTNLPRGTMVSGKDQNDLFWQVVICPSDEVSCPHSSSQSVHLCGEASAQAQEEALEAEKKAWRDKVVVDTTDFKVGPAPPLCSPRLGN
jgi:hypothetical protein